MKRLDDFFKTLTQGLMKELKKGDVIITLRYDKIKNSISLDKDDADGGSRVEFEDIAHEAVKSHRKRDDSSLRGV